MASSGVDGLSGVVRRRVVEQGSPGYDEARALYNAMIDKHPGIFSVNQNITPA